MTAAEDAEAVAQEGRLRKRLRRQGYVLAKCRVRNPMAVGHGTYLIADDRRCIVAGGHGPGGYGLTLDDVERFAAEKP